MESLQRGRVLERPHMLAKEVGYLRGHLLSPPRTRVQLGSGTLMLTLPGTFSGRNGGAGLADPH